MKKIRNYIVWLLAIVLVGGVTGTVLAAGGGGVVTADPTKHFDSKGKMPSEFTIELQNGLRKSLPFEDKRDFEEAKKGFIAAPPYKQIMAEAGNVA
jgi:alkyl sulfatase BDS1-like metallo-beta-lactamase superfamily hydrolase